MTEPLTFTVLDPQTMNELQPPCEATVCEPQPADWIARFRCDLCGFQPQQLFCDLHFGHLTARHIALCTACGEYGRAYTLVASEPLR